MFLSKVIKKFWNLQDGGESELSAAESGWKSYKGIHLVPYKKWQPTKGNAKERRGPVPPPFKMLRKPGPAPKIDKPLTAKAKQLLLRNPDLSNASIAQRLETAKK